MDSGAMRPLLLLFLSVQTRANLLGIVQGNSSREIPETNWKKKDISSSVLGVTKRCCSKSVKAINKSGKPETNSEWPPNQLGSYRRDQHPLGSFSAPVIQAKFELSIPAYQ